MKHLLLIPVMSIFLGTSFVTVFAQNDTIKVSYSEESPDSVNYNFKRKYQYIDLNMRNEKDLLKFGIAPFHTSLDESITLDFRIGYERKLNSSFSIDLTTFNHIYKFVYKMDEWTTDGTLSLRYYYGMKKKIKDGVSGDNLNHNFYRFGITSTIYYEGENSYPPAYIDFGWGLQRRLGQFGYFNGIFSLNKGVKNTLDTQWVFMIDLEIGLGFNLIHKK
jgi:hypothetical protein